MQQRYRAEYGLLRETAAMKLFSSTLLRAENGLTVEKVETPKRWPHWSPSGTRSRKRAGTSSRSALRVGGGLVEALRRDKLAVRDPLALRVVRGAAGKLVAGFPLMLTQRPGTGPVHVRILQPFGADPNMTELRTPLLDPRRAAEAVAALRAHLDADLDGCDWVRWPWLRQDTGATEPLSAGAAVQWEQEIPITF